VLFTSQKVPKSYPLKIDSGANNDKTTGFTVVTLSSAALETSDFALVAPPK